MNVVPQRPNIVFIFTDQQFADAMSCAGNRDLRTPAMDGLARTGVRFENAYCTYPLCTPSRASMFTGLMPHQIEVYGNECPIPEQRLPLELGHVLSRGGYDCVYGGKWHVPELSIPDGHGFRNICDLNDWDLADRCIEYLHQPHDRPFFLVASFDNPHNICEWSRQTPLPWGSVPAATTAECPNLPANFAIPAYEPEAVGAERVPRPKSIFRAGGLSPDDWRQYRHAYYRMTEWVDVEIGRVIDAVRAAGHAENTVLIFSSDHGDGVAAHQWNQKSVLYEESVRVPLIISNADGSTIPRVDAEHLISTGLDLFPTICDYAQVEPPTDLPGRSLRTLAEGRSVDAWRDHVIAETFFGPEIGGLGTHGRMVRTEHYKYIMYSWGKHREQLFDMRTDPGEMVNLAIEHRYRGILEEHRSLLERWMVETGDRSQQHYALPDAPPIMPGHDYQRP